MGNRSALVLLSTAQLTAQLAGHVVAVRRRRYFDVPFMTGSPDHLVRDWLWFGTAYSAPPYLLGPQIWATARLVRGPDERARVVLRWLGTGLSLGYLSERSVRVRVRPAGFDPVESPVAGVGWSCAFAMALLGSTRAQDRARPAGRRRARLRPRAGRDLRPSDPARERNPSGPVAAGASWTSLTRPAQRPARQPTEGDTMMSAVVRSRATGVSAVGASASGARSVAFAAVLAFASAASAFAAVAIYRVVIQQLAIKQMQVGTLEIDELTVRRLHVLERD